MCSDLFKKQFDILCGDWGMGFWPGACFQVWLGVLGGGEPDTHCKLLLPHNKAGNGGGVRRG